MPLNEDTAEEEEPASGSSEGVTLSLDLAVSGAEVIEEYLVSRSIRLAVREGNRVRGLVNGRWCSLILDSGSNKTCMFSSLAKKLGLVHGQKTDIETYRLWMGDQEVEFITLKNVTITLEGGVSVLTSIRVLSEALEIHYNTEDVVLDVHLLRRGAMVQTFNKSGSSLFICEPGRLHRNTTVKDHDKVLYFRVQRTNTEAASPLSIMLDTGAENLYVSRSVLDAFPDLMNEHRMPQQVTLDLGDNHCLETDQVEFIGQEAVDLVMGVHLLHKYNAVVDYGNLFVTFTVRGKHFKVKLYLE